MVVWDFLDKLEKPRVQSKSFENSVEMEELLVLSNFSCYHGVFYLFGDLTAIFTTFEILFKLFQLGRVLRKFVVWEKVYHSKDLVKQRYELVTLWYELVIKYNRTKWLWYEVTSYRF